MCGIVGYVGERQANEVLLDGLRRLEYRGYDSAGVALLGDGEIKIRRCVGKINELVNSLAAQPIEGSVGMGHTRWATHGKPSEENAHPHQAGSIVLVHNGIIENYLSLRRSLEAKGRKFSSETDSEIVSHLIDQELSEGRGFVDAVRTAVNMLQGAYAFVIGCSSQPNTLIAARRSSPLIVGYGEGENLIASDAAALLPFTRRVDFLEDGELAVVTRESIEIFGPEGKPIQREPQQLSWDPIAAEKGGHKHFMHKEIFEQPVALVNTLSGRLSFAEHSVYFDEQELPPGILDNIERVCLVACGTAYHAGMVGRSFFETIARMPADVELASEFRYRDLVIDQRTLVVLVSQSGETADTLAAMREAKLRGLRTVAVCNVIDSTIARDADAVIYTHAGPEIGVASTKAFTCQMAVLYLLAVHIGCVRGMLNEEQVVGYLEGIARLPVQMEEILASEGYIRHAARQYRNQRGYLFLGRGLNVPIAFEGALKLKEISYLHAEGYPGGEMKHGPIALIDEQMVCLVLLPKSETYDKMLSNVQEIQAREGKVLAVAAKGDQQAVELADSLFLIPDVPEILSPFLTVIPLQLFAYHVADIKGTDVDQPRNLAKSVTVE
ncbi:MAG: glutamine--fructose-6-phosphate transaminase (isomerizing) [Candidatus Alcyoniella australis]|nr:glutamine--fructose-6-phosphate transaminase (isomerizing) [Candidatus Alcyoniella australis]